MIEPCIFMADDCFYTPAYKYADIFLIITIMEKSYKIIQEFYILFYILLYTNFNILIYYIL